MNNVPISIIPDVRWKVPFEDSGFWRTGIYRPEFKCEKEIQVLERHSCPELFLCMNGRMGLVIRDEGGERTIVVEPGQALNVTGFHNGFSIDPAGYFFVVERTAFETIFIDRASGAPVLKSTRAQP